jgi:hypothetical protein
MNLIHNQLADIKNSAEQIETIVDRYKCGFITIPEMLGQIADVQTMVKGTYAEIEIEYGINTNAVNIMLTL